MYYLGEHICLWYFIFEHTFHGEFKQGPKVACDEEFFHDGIFAEEKIFKRNYLYSEQSLKKHESNYVNIFSPHEKKI